MDEIRDQLSFIDFTALTRRLVELEAARKVAQWTQTDEWEEDGELERLIDLRDQLLRSPGAEIAGPDNPALPGGTHVQGHARLREDERAGLGRLRRGTRNWRCGVTCSSAAWPPSCPAPLASAVT
ncbi:MAG: hypothetical protein JO157_02820 [Acetobacteraceae bacterium]|nr:hypothetical protein [Acetobacteraceae bacterium]